VRNRIKTRKKSAKLGEGLHRALAAVLERTWESIERDSLPEADRGLRLIEAEGIRCREALLNALTVAEAVPLLPGEEPSGVETRGAWAETVAREAGVDVCFGEKALVPLGEKTALAFEQAFLVSLLGGLGTLREGFGRDPERRDQFVWENNLPLTRLPTAHGREVAVIAARPDPHRPGSGLGVALIEYGPGDDDGPDHYRVRFHLLVPQERPRDGELVMHGMAFSAKR